METKMFWIDLISLSHFIEKKNNIYFSQHSVLVGVIILTYFFSVLQAKFRVRYFT
jgi:hypothetical protein